MFYPSFVHAVSNVNLALYLFVLGDFWAVKGGSICDSSVSFAYLFLSNILHACDCTSKEMQTSVHQY